MSIQTRIADYCAQNDEQVRHFAQEKRIDSDEFCKSNGGHYYTPWKAVAINPVFNVVCTEERRCTACNTLEVRTPTHSELRAASPSTFEAQFDREPFSFRDDNLRSGSILIHSDPDDLD